MRAARVDHGSNLRNALKLTEGRGYQRCGLRCGAASARRVVPTKSLQRGRRLSERKPCLESRVQQSRRSAATLKDGGGSTRMLWTGQMGLITRRSGLQIPLSMIRLECTPLIQHPSARFIGGA
jgi:hypothetical protein